MTRGAAVSGGARSIGAWSVLLALAASGIGDPGVAGETASAEAVVERFLAACAVGDEASLRAALHPEALLLAQAPGPDGAPAVLLVSVAELLSRSRSPRGEPGTVELVEVMPRIASAKVRWPAGSAYLGLACDANVWRVRQVLVVGAAPGEGEQGAGEARDAVTDARGTGEAYLTALESRPAWFATAAHASFVRHGYRGSGPSAQMLPETLNAAQLAVAVGSDPPAPAAGPRLVELRDVEGAAALVRVVGPWGVEHLLVARVGARWLALASLWQSFPPEVGLTLAGLRTEDALRPSCPFSGRPIAPDSLCLYRGRVVGFCNPGCRDKFAREPARWRAQLPELEGGG